ASGVGRSAYRDDLEGPGDPVMLGDGHVLARLEGVGFEAIARFVLFGLGADVVVKRPAPAGTMHQMAKLVIALRREAPNGAELSLRLPRGGVDMRLRVERRGKLVAVPRVPVGMLGGPRQLQSN